MPVPPVADVLIARDELRGGVERLAHDVSAAYTDGVVLVAVLKGSLIFLADLVRSLTILPAVDFLAISRYEPDSGRVRLVKDLDSDITGRDVLLVEGIVDTGLSLGYLLGELRRREPGIARGVHLAGQERSPDPADALGLRRASRSPMCSCSATAWISPAAIAIWMWSSRVTSMR